MAFNRKDAVGGILLLILLLAGCATPPAPTGGGMQPLELADAAPIPLPAPIVDQLPPITQIAPGEAMIVFQAMDVLLAVDPHTGDSYRWQVQFVDAGEVPVNGEQVQLQRFILWRDGRFYNLPTGHNTRQMELAPDGRRIAYSSMIAPFLIHLSTVDGTENWLWPHLGHNPTWSPDGQHLAFYGWDDTGAAIHLFTADEDGGNLTSLMQMDFPAGDILAPQLAWSPDGSRLALLDNLSDRGRNRLYLLHADGHAPTLLYEPTDARLEDFRWSEDGSKLAFLSVATTGDNSRLQVVDTGNGTRIADYPDVRAFAWSPDSSQLAMGVCVYEEGVCPFDLFLGPATGGQRSQLTRLALALGNGLDIPDTGRLVWFGGLE